MPTPNSLSREKKEAQRVELLDLICEAFQLPARKDQKNRSSNKLKPTSAATTTTTDPTSTTSSAVLPLQNEDFLYNKVESILDQTDTSDEAVLVLQLLHNRKLKEAVAERKKKQQQQIQQQKNKNKKLLRNNNDDDQFVDEENANENDDDDDDETDYLYCDSASSVADKLQKMIQTSERTDKDYLGDDDDDDDEDDEEEDEDEGDNDSRNQNKGNEKKKSDKKLTTAEQRAKEEKRRREILMQIPGGAAAAFLRNAMNLENDGQDPEKNVGDEDEQQRKLDEIILRYRGGIGGSENLKS